MVKETKIRVSEKIDELAKSISSSEPGTPKEKNLVTNLAMLAKLEQEDEKQDDIREANKNKAALEREKLEHEKKEFDFKRECEQNRKDESDSRVLLEYRNLEFKEKELRFKKECEQNRHEEAMAKIEAERAFEEFRFDQDLLSKQREDVSRRREYLLNAAKIGFGTAVGIGSIMVTIYTVKAATTVDKDFDAMPSKTLTSLMIRGIQKVNI